MADPAGGSGRTGGYTTRDVARILDLSPRTVRRYVRVLRLTTERGARNQYRFTFQELVLIRTARELETARVPTRHIHRALRQLRSQLPEGRPLTSVRITAEGERVVVVDGDTAWSPESGQVQLDFRVAEIAARTAPIDRAAVEGGARRELDADGWFELGLDLESSSPDLALDCYRRALELEPGHADAHVNLGYQLQEEGDLEAACRHYRSALAANPQCAVAAFNLGVALEDLKRSTDAIAAYSRAIDADPQMADAYYNLSRLYEAAGDRAAALRHLRSYSQLVH